MSDLAELTYEDFFACVGQTFVLTHPAGVVELQLDTAEPASHDALQRDSRQPFSLVFRGPRQFQLQQGMYLMEHSAIGAHELFIVPIKADPQWVYYEAVFS